METQIKLEVFQNMLQRYALYKFSNSDEEIVKNSEILFKDDIDRSQAAVPRTRNEIIYDRWVIQSQDDPSVEEVDEMDVKLWFKTLFSIPYLSTIPFNRLIL